MKHKNEITPYEKVQIFNKLHDKCITNLKASVDDKYDSQYFWEEVIENILEFSSTDWDTMHDEGLDSILKG